MNNEPYDDNTNRHGRQQCATNEELLDQWSINNCKTTAATNVVAKRIQPSADVLSTCAAFFRSKVSDFEECFAVVDPLHYYEMCLDLGMSSLIDTVPNGGAPPVRKGICTVALAYLEVCGAELTPQRVPTTCIL